MRITIKDKIYITLKTLGGKATHKELVEKYIELNPDFSINYKNTKTSSVAKISGTIDSLLNRGIGHPKINRNQNTSPCMYEIKD